VPFRSRPGQPRDLLAQIQDEVRERIREAIDHVAIEALVEARRAGGLAHPSVDNPVDRGEFDAGALAFLQRLGEDVAAGIPEETRRRADDAAARAGSDPVLRLLAAQVVLARALPDYWQRFEAARAAHLARPTVSGGQGRGLLRRLLGG
jgi:hypothetical protein